MVFVIERVHVDKRTKGNEQICHWPVSVSFYEKLAVRGLRNQNYFAGVFHFLP